MESDARTLAGMSELTRVFLFRIRTERPLEDIFLKADLEAYSQREYALIFAFHIVSSYLREATYRRGKNTHIVSSYFREATYRRGKIHIA